MKSKVTQKPILCSMIHITTHLNIKDNTYFVLMFFQWTTLVSLVTDATATKRNSSDILKQLQHRKLTKSAANQHRNYETTQFSYQYSCKSTISCNDNVYQKYKMSCCHQTKIGCAGSKASDWSTFFLKIHFSE